MTDIGATDTGADPVTVHFASTAEPSEALDLLATSQEDPDRGTELRHVIAELTQTGAPIGLLEARRGGRLVGSVATCVMGGRTAGFWPPKLIRGEPEETAERLHHHAEYWLRLNRVRLVQATLADDAGRDARWLRLHGFGYQVDLLYLACPSDRFPAAHPSSDCRLVAYCPADRARLGRLIERTYEGTLDCPQLNGMREVGDILDGYQQTGEFDPSRWSFLQHEGQDVGCLLLASHPQQQQWELVYLGLIPGARGRGWGLDATRQGQWLAAQAGCRQMVLAVDADNRPAIAAYAAAGFQAWNRRSVLLKVLEALEA